MEFNILEICLLTALCICFFVHLYYVIGVHAKLVGYRIADLPNSTSQPLSVVICARNERENLEKYLPSVFEQDYPNFEVVVVNDRSWDGTADFLETLQKKYSNLKVVHVAEGEKFIAGKKFAATMGIKAASHEWLVFTDADCEPATKNWLKGMQTPADNQVDILLGYSPYFKKRSLLNALIRFETFFTAVNYLSFALKGMPYMGVGRNMAYKKSLFFKNKGFAAHMHIPSGDDDLFVNANATPVNTIIQIHKDTHVWSEPKNSFLSYLRQKKRHIGAGNLYKTKHKFILSTQIAVQFFFYALAITLACFPRTHFIAFGVFLFSLMVRCFVYPQLLKCLNYGELRWWFPILDIILMAFLVFNAILSIFVKKVQWK
ncbi:glycosyltransferase [Pedobacter helvus]|uniref:Glycosyltransferase n=1 Tax=Pedobacter helvus TaxID=2563444 RepID=A0ABW9JER9_9SPHI|nr:glycosyltransferase [Pedobacter ureilyticus]